MRRLKELGGFVFLSLLSSLAVFQDAMWGRSIAAPLDIAAALWPHYQHVDPLQGPVPKNHYTVDQLGYDLPLQFLMHQAWRNGEIPWWNPYSSGGRPLLADAHCNGTDPIRLIVYFTVPNFVLAYNWTLILHAVGTGLGAYGLLRRFGARPWVAGLCALGAQWAGGYVLYIGHPWVRASFIYYPFLWMAWDGSFQIGKLSRSAPLIVAAIFYAGNLQSHMYLPIFALCIAAGCAGRSLKAWWQATKFIAPAGILGALMAAPVLVPQVELYLHAVRPLGELPRLYWLETGAVLGAIHPWMAGTFRTLSIKSVNGGPNFHLAIGGVLVVLALFGWFRRKLPGANMRVLATAALLVVAFLFIAFTPLHPILYLRAAGLGILGLIVLAAWGAEALLRSTQPETRWSRATWTIAAALALGTALLAHAVYPCFRPRAETMLLARAETDGSGGASRELRKSQAASFQAELSPLNPECAFNLASLALLGFAFARRGGVRVPFVAACASSLVPVLSFSERFITRSPVETWTRLLVGGPVQKPIIALLTPTGLSLQDEAPQEFARVFPMELSVLYRLHVAHGYAALHPWNAAANGEASVSADVRLGTSGEILASGIGRFYWKSGSDRKVRIINESLNHLNLEFGSGDEDMLIRTDTRYAGWTANRLPGKAAGRNGIFSEMLVRAGETAIVCEYRPSGWPICAFSTAVGVLGCAILAGSRRKKGALPSSF